MSKIENSMLDQYGAEPFEQQQFGTAGIEKVKAHFTPSGETKCRPTVFCPVTSHRINQCGLDFRVVDDSIEAE